MTSPWTDERVERLTELWNDGRTASQIGRALDVSRNAVIGKAHRLELPGRPSPILRNGTAEARRQAALARATAPGRTA